MNIQILPPLINLLIEFGKNLSKFRMKLFILNNKISQSQLIILYGRKKHQKRNSQNSNSL